MKRIIVLIPALLFSLSLLAQRNKNIPPTGSITCSEFAISRPLSEIAKEFPVDESKPYEKEESEDRENRKPQRFKFTAAGLDKRLRAFVPTILPVRPDHRTMCR